MRRHLLWLFLLLQALVAAQNQRPLRATGRHVHADVAPAQANVDAFREPGADLVDAAMHELRKLHHPHHHKSRKRGGLVNTVLHYALKLVPTLRMSAPPSAADPSKPDISGPLRVAVKLLEESSQQNNSDALFLLAQFNFYGNHSYPRDFGAAFKYYHKLAQLNGNSSAHYMMGMMYSTGVGGAVPRDQARALIYYTFAADAGHTRAEMALGFRHLTGIATPKNCELAARYYKRVADKAVAWYRSAPPGGMVWVKQAYKLAEESGGVYGEGASFSSAGMNSIRHHHGHEAYASIDDVIEYLDLMSQKGDFKASFNLGRIYYEGQRRLERDMDLARKYFLMITSKYWRNGRIVENPKPGLDKYAGRAAGYLGRMYMRGEGVAQSFERAKYWFDRGKTSGDAQSQWGLGLLLLNGYGVRREVKEATDLFRSAADQDFAPAAVQLGSLYLDQGHAEDVAVAVHYFEMAARHGNMEAYYYLGEMSMFGAGREISCSTAVTFYKSVSERAEALVSSWSEANMAHEDGDLELAFLGYLSAAEQGYESAQNNVAYMLDTETSRLPIPEWVTGQAPKPSLLQDPSLALIQWTRSARQSNIDSMVKMGDYYLNGIGIEPDIDKAVQCYQGASEFHQSAQALFNLGWMHENGVGLTQDYHLAKRYYDHALEANEEAYLPVTLSLLKLRARSAWNTLTHGRINSIQDEPTITKDWSLSEWIANFLQDDMEYYDDDPLYHDHDAYDDTMPNGGPGLDLDDSILESLAIVGLAAALVFLIMYRHQRQQAARRRDEEEEEARRRLGRQQQGQGAGQAEADGVGQWGGAVVGQ